MRHRWTTVGTVALLVGLVAALIGVGVGGGGAAIAAGGAPPTPPDLPPGELGTTIELGRTLVEHTNTNPLSRPYVGNDLTCQSCHLHAGTDARAATFVGTAAAFPAYSPREKAVITLEDRIDNCFVRSMNGTRPPLGSRVSVAIAAYITWLSQGTPIRQNPDRPTGPNVYPALSLDPASADLGRGATLYNSKCAACHGREGQGVGGFPPVWGDRSFNAGAGLSHTAKLASWLKVAMPYGNPSLSDKDALDIAAFVDSHPRPAFNLQDHLPAAQDMGVYNATVTQEQRSVQPGAINP